MIKEHDNFIYFLRVLTKYSDCNHPMSVSQIISKFKECYDVTLTKQTVYNYLSMADSMNIDINSCTKGRYIASRQLEEGEATFLIHSIISNRSLSEKYTKDLVGKILGTQSVYYDSGIQNIYVADKKDNKALLLNVDLINKAIKDHVKISFDYTKYGYDGEVIPFREKKYTVSPLFIICRDSNLYLICKYDTKDTIFSFRIDKIFNLELTTYEIEYAYDIDPKEYSKHRLYMYNGKIEEFVLRCNENVLDDIYDNFGKKIKPYNIENGTFDVKVKTTEKAIMFFAHQYVDSVTILYPMSTKEKMKDELKRAIGKYY